MNLILSGLVLFMFSAEASAQFIKYNYSSFQGLNVKKLDDGKLEVAPSPDWNSTNLDPTTKLFSLTKKHIYPTEMTSKIAVVSTPSYFRVTEYRETKNESKKVIFRKLSNVDETGIYSRCVQNLESEGNNGKFKCSFVNDEICRAYRKAFNPNTGMTHGEIMRCMDYFTTVSKLQKKLIDQMRFTVDQSLTTVGYKDKRTLEFSSDSDTINPWNDIANCGELDKFNNKPPEAVSVPFTPDQFKEYQKSPAGVGSGMQK